MSDINKKTRAARAGFVMSPEEKVNLSRKQLASYNQLQFPSDLAAYGFIMNFQKFTFNAGSADGNSEYNPVNIKTENSIILPIPSPLNQNYSVLLILASSKLFFFSTSSYSQFCSSSKYCFISSLLLTPPVFFELRYFNLYLNMIRK